MSTQRTNPISRRRLPGHYVGIEDDRDDRRRPRELLDARFVDGDILENGESVIVISVFERREEERWVGARRRE